MLRSGKLSTKTVYNIASSLLNGNPNLLFQQTRTTFILKRKNKVRLFKKEAIVRPLKRQDYFYELIEDTDIKKKPPLDLILLEDIKEYGKKGQRVEVKRMAAYNKLLLPKFAVYATPENIKKYQISFEEEKKIEMSSPFVVQTLEILRRCCLIVRMSSKHEWELQPTHIRVNFRILGIHLKDDCIEMPDNIICGPNYNYEGKEFFVIVTINKTEKVHVRCRLFHIDKEKEKYENDRTRFLKPGDAIFLEDQPILDSLPRPKWEDNWDKNRYE